MQHETLLTELSHRNIVLTLSNEGKLQYTAPKGAVTSDIAALIKQHGKSIVQDLREATQRATNTVATMEPDTQHEQVAPNKTPWRPATEQLQAWATYYGNCAWYRDKNIFGDNPVGLALEYALSDDIGSCTAWLTKDLFCYYANCQQRNITIGLDSVSPVEPRQFTELVRIAYQKRNLDRIRVLASNFHTGSDVDDIVTRYHKAIAHHTETPDASHKQVDHTEQEPDTEQLPIVTKSNQVKRQWVTVFADIDTGHAVTEQGTVIEFPASCSLATFLAYVQKVTHVNRVYLCGKRPGGTSEQFIKWLASPDLLQEYTTDAKGHYLDVRKPDASVVRYQHRFTKETIDIRRVNSWLGDVASTDEQEPRYTVEDARDTLSLATRYIRQFFHKDMNLSGTPGATFKRLWTEGNRIAGKKFTPLPDEIRTIIHSNAGQGRIEFFKDNSSGKIPGLYYYDGIFMYSALTWGMPTEIASHDNLNQYAGKVPARYHIRFTVPANWQHVGLFMVKRENGWFYPGKNEVGNTYETWADGAELDIAYNLPSGMPEWDITILERVVFKTEKESSVIKPLNTITEKLVKIRDELTRDARQDGNKKHIYKLASGIIRNILLHGIGSFNRQTSERSYILLDTETAPSNYSDYDEIDEHTRWYKVTTEQVDTSMSHPEYAALIWARCRARMTKAALSLPYSDVVTIRTDAIAVKRPVPEWEDNTANGKLRRKWAIEKQLQAPANDEQFDNIQRKVTHK